ncbi:hypothetical protein GCE9029_01018 [Grimontia celer]|uniref:Uncharacterized protein n=1 Tax=Grimontia celer TaxID=1796497 RepID=A0A128EVY9_9GAMM|nr:hypothetical protein [Grimontia celer]CZF78727.1 hypothetical protein GCE9029_01018 [Grimontia celer]
MNMPPNIPSAEKPSSFWNKVPTIVGWLCIVSSVLASGMLFLLPVAVDRLEAPQGVLGIDIIIHAVNLVKVVLGVFLIKKQLWAAAALFFLHAVDVGYSYYSTGTAGSFGLTFLAIYFLAARCVYDYHMSPQLTAK